MEWSDLVGKTITIARKEPGCERGEITLEFSDGAKVSLRSEYDDNDSPGVVLVETGNRLIPPGEFTRRMAEELRKGRGINVFGACGS